MLTDLDTPNRLSGNDELLVKHAVVNLWANPYIDKQSRIVPIRLTSGPGAMHTANFYRFSVSLPTQGHYYHVFQLGAIPNNYLGLLDKLNTWTPVPDIMNSTNTLIQMFYGSIMIPRHLMWFLRRPDGNLLIAVRVSSKLDDYTKQNFIVRFYTNALGQSAADPEFAYISQCFGRTISSQEDLSAVYNQWLQYSKMEGHTLVYHNGRVETNFNTAHYRMGDLVEVENDVSMKGFSDFNIHSLPTFTSLKDNLRKYLLHPENSDGEFNNFDDIDCYLISTQPDGTDKGVYYNRSFPATMRQLTHNDLAIPTGTIDSMVSSYPDVLSGTNLRLRCYMRDNGFDRELLPIHNRCRELYKFPDDEIVAHMVGSHRAIPEWRAENLENSEYMDLVTWPNSRFDANLVSKAYGYNGLVKAFAQPLVKVEQNKCVIPPVYRNKCLALEVKNGLLDKVRYIYKYTDELHWNTEAPDFVLFLYGAPDHYFEKPDVYEEGVIDIPSEDWCVLGRKREPSNTQFDWEDVTDNAEYVKLENGKIHLLKDQRLYEYYYRPASFMGEFSANYYTGDWWAMDFYVPKFDGIYRNVVVTIDDKFMVRGIDYDFYENKLVVFSANLPKNRWIRIKMWWFGCPLPKDLNMALEEKGFVKHNLVSWNDSYMLKDDFLTVMTVNNQLQNPDNWKFSEDVGALTGNGDPAIDGSLYSIIRLIPPCGNLDIGVSERELLRRALSLDKRLGDYLTQVKPKPPSDKPVVVNQRWRTASPFMMEVYRRLEELLPWGEEFITDKDLDTRLGPHKWLLDIDPAAKVVDDNYIVVRPYGWKVDEPIEVPARYYDILSRVNKKYLHGQVPINQHFTIVGEE